MRDYLRSLYLLCCLAVLAGMIGPATASAAGNSASAAVTQSYTADSQVVTGMIVELKPNTTSTVTPLASRDIRDMSGVVVPTGDAAIVLSPQSATTQQVLVASSGRYGVLVSNQNGPIKAGDYLTISALAGISMKASADQPEVIGRAAGGFEGTTDIIGTVALKNSLGRTTTASIGYVPVDVQLAQNPQFQNASNLPSFLSKAANGVANKPVSSLRIYLSVFVLLATLLITGSMLYGGVRGGVVATGRNPLAKKAIGRSLIRTILAAFVIFAAGILALYVILSL